MSRFHLLIQGNKSTAYGCQHLAVAAFFQVTFELKKLEVLKKSNNFNKNSKSKKGHNSSKNEFGVISVCKYFPFYSEHIF